MSNAANLTVKDFQIGDRVWHASRNEAGTIEDTDDRGVTVLFDRPTPRGRESRGGYDHEWFRTVGLLSKISTKDPPDAR